MAATRQNDMNVSITVLATKTGIAVFLSVFMPEVLLVCMLIDSDVYPDAPPHLTATLSPWL